VFVFHYVNHSDLPLHVTPTYTLTCTPTARYAANEEVAAYIEDALEDELHLTEETPMAFEVPSHGTKHDIATFERPLALTAFDVDVEVFSGRAWRLHYERQGRTWINSANREVIKYDGRG
jgi:hypothetical protein